MSDALDFLFQGTPPAAVNANVTSQTNMPDWYQAYTQGLLSRSNAIAAEPYQAYTGQRVAPATTDQNAAYGLVENNVGSYQPYNQAAGQMLSNAGSGFNQDEFNKFQNPYQQSAMDSLASQSTRNLTQNVLPAVNDTFTTSGQFGGSRNSQFLNNAVQNNQQDLLNSQATMLNQGTQNAMQNYLTSNQQQIGAGQQMGVLGQEQQQGLYKDAAGLQSIGQEQQQLGQTSLDTAYNDFLDQRNYPIQMAQFMNQQVRGFNPPTSTSSYSTSPGSVNNQTPGALSSLAGLATSAAGLSGLPSSLAG